MFRGGDVNASTPQQQNMTDINHKVFLDPSPHLNSRQNAASCPDHEFLFQEKSEKEKRVTSDGLILNWKDRFVPRHSASPPKSPMRLGIPGLSTRRPKSPSSLPCPLSSAPGWNILRMNITKTAVRLSCTVQTLCRSSRQESYCSNSPIDRQSEKEMTASHRSLCRVYLGCASENFFRGCFVVLSAWVSKVEPDQRIPPQSSVG